MRPIRPAVTRFFLRRAGVTRRGALLLVPSAALLALPALILPSAVGGASALPRYSTADCPWVGATDVPAQQRAAEVVAQMTLDEKASMAAIPMSPPPAYENSLPGVARLCIPPLHLQDGPAGVAGIFTNVTQLPAPIALAATWDPALAASYGSVIAAEARAKGIGVMQTPDVDIARVPVSGRNYEAFGEDPYLTSRMSVSEIEAIQRAGVVADVKHFVGNNQETNRLSINADIDERALRELYFPAFDAAVREAKVGSAMCAYNQVNAAFACQSSSLLSDVLRGELGFTGFVRSDLGAVHDLQAALSAGTDVVKPFSPDDITSLVAQGKLDETVLDGAVEHVLTTMFAAGLVDQPLPETPYATATSAGHRSVAARIASAGTVLLRNAPVNRRRMLPFSGRRPSSIALIGAGAYSNPRLRGGGSSAVEPTSVVTPLEALRARAPRTPVRYAIGAPNTQHAVVVPMTRLTTADGLKPGLDVAYSDTTTNAPQGQSWSGTVDADFGTPSAPTAPEGLSPGHFQAVWSGFLQANRTGSYRLELTSDDGGQVSLDGRTLINGTTSGTRFTTVSLAAGARHRLRVTYTDRVPGGHVSLRWRPAADPGASMAAAARLAARSDVAVVFASDNEGEGRDRADLALPAGQDRLIEAVAARNPRTIVVLDTGGPVLMPWLGKVAAVLQAWYPGEMDGQALTSVLWGSSGPSGRLPQTFPATSTDLPATKSPDQWPGVDGTAVYREGLGVGYRGFDAAGIRPLFPFGFGLSYTRFRLSRLQISATGTGAQQVSFDVANVGSRRGVAVPQAYVAFPTSVAEPPRVLRGFAKVVLAPGATRRVTLSLPPSAFQYWDTDGQRWQTAPGEYTVQVGQNSRDLPLHGIVSAADLAPGTAP